MKGLMQKELYEMKRYWKTYLIYLMVFGGMAIFTGSVSMYSVMAAVFMTSIPLSSFTTDEARKWDGFALSMPVSRRQMVGAKYLLFLCCAALSVLSGLVIIVAGVVLRPGSMELGLELINTAVITVVMSVMMLVLLPILFRVGAAKGRMLMLLIFGGTFLLILLAAMLAQKMGMMDGASGGVDVNFLPIAAVGLVVLAVGAFLSYQLSCVFYQKREF